MNNWIDIRKQSPPDGIIWVVLKGRMEIDGQSFNSLFSSIYYSMFITKKERNNIVIQYEYGDRY